MNDARDSEATKPSQSKKGVARLIAATSYSIAGIKTAFKNEEAFRLEIAAFIVLTPIAFWLGNSNVERVLLIGSLVLVLLMELVNSALEAVVDRFGGEFHELSRAAKDIGSAAVGISLLLVLFTWGMLLL